MRPPVVDLLRRSTQPIHDRVEATLGLLDPDLGRARLATVVATLGAFFVAAESGVDRWATSDPDLAGRLDWSRRRRAASYAADLTQLDGSVIAAAPELWPSMPTSAQVLAWLYVAEGSTLGGAVIDRTLRPRGLRLLSFAPYAEGPGPMWQSYQRILAEWVAAEPSAGARGESVVAEAVDVFTVLAEWCDQRCGRSQHTGELSSDPSPPPAAVHALRVGP